VYPTLFEEAAVFVGVSNCYQNRLYEKDKATHIITPFCGSYCFD